MSRSPEVVADVLGLVVLVAGGLWPRRSTSRAPGPCLGRSWVSGSGPGTSEGRRLADELVRPSLARGTGRGSRVGRFLRVLREPRDDPSEGLLGLLDVLSPALRVGLAPVVALQHVAASRQDRTTEPVDELLSDLIAHASLGRPLAPVWRRWAETSSGPDLMLVASAWHLSETLGAPLAEAVASAAAMVRERRTRRRRLEVTLAGPRSTATVLSALPLAGPLVAALFGIGPVELYTGPAAVSGVAGVVLLLLGRMWCRRLVASVSRPRPLADGQRRRGPPR